jgi:flagellar biosynthesis chaperone FliJ
MPIHTSGGEDRVLEQIDQWAQQVRDLVDRLDTKLDDALHQIQDLERELADAREQLKEKTR